MRKAFICNPEYLGANSGPYCYSALRHAAGQRGSGGSAKLHPATGAQPHAAACGVSVRSGAQGAHVREANQRKNINS